MKFVGVGFVVLAIVAFVVSGFRALVLDVQILT